MYVKKTSKMHIYLINLFQLNLPLHILNWPVHHLEAISIHAAYSISHASVGRQAANMIEIPWLMFFMISLWCKAKCQGIIKIWGMTHTTLPITETLSQNCSLPPSRWQRPSVCTIELLWVQTSDIHPAKFFSTKRTFAICSRIPEYQHVTALSQDKKAISIGTIPVTVTSFQFCSASRMTDKFPLVLTRTGTI